MRVSVRGARGGRGGRAAEHYVNKGRQATERKSPARPAASQVHEDAVDLGDDDQQDGNEDSRDKLVMMAMRRRRRG